MNNLVYDEFGSYFGASNDSLKEDLRKIDGIPNATYWVKDRQVFVFNKLVQLVNERLEQQSDLPLAELAISLVPEATVSAKEAIENWGVVPEPYEMVGDTATGLMIRHRPFNSRLPGLFKEKGGVQTIFASLLLGDTHSGDGDFTYRGQPMTLCEPLDLAALPLRPVFKSEGSSEGAWCYTVLGRTTYEQGFEPVDEALFDCVKASEAAWRVDTNQAARYAQEHAAAIWARSATLQFETLDDPTDSVPEYGQDDLTALRSLYPELLMLSDGSLFEWFDYYQMECCHNNGWTATRDDSFLFYLLGKSVGRLYEGMTEDVGLWVAYALLHDNDLSAALAFGRATELYNSAISRLARRIANVMQFLAEDKNAVELHGKAITTAMDVFRLGRKINTTTLNATQVCQTKTAEAP